MFQNTDWTEMERPDAAGTHLLDPEAETLYEWAPPFMQRAGGETEGEAVEEEGVEEVRGALGLQGSAKRRVDDDDFDDDDDDFDDDDDDFDDDLDEDFDEDFDDDDDFDDDLDEDEDL